MRRTSICGAAETLFIDKKCIDYLSIDLIWNGLTESKKILRLDTVKIKKN